MLSVISENAKAMGRGRAKAAEDKDPFAVALGARVRKRREELGLTQRELSRLARYDAVQLSRLESGEAVPRADAVLRLATQLRIPIGRLYGLPEGISTLPADVGGAGVIASVAIQSAFMAAATRAPKAEQDRLTEEALTALNNYLEAGGQEEGVAFVLREAARATDAFLRQQVLLPQVEIDAEPLGFGLTDLSVMEVVREVVQNAVEASVKAVTLPDRDADETESRLNDKQAELLAQGGLALVEELKTIRARLDALEGARSRKRA